MAEPDALLPPDAQWWFAHQGCAALVWDGDSGDIVRANAVAGRLFGLDVQAGSEPIRDVFNLPYGLASDDVAVALGFRQPRVCLLPRAGADALRLLLITWRMPSPGPARWASLCLELDALAATTPAGDATAAHMELLYQLSPLMYFTVAPNLAISGVNRTALEQLGYRREELIGRPVTDVFHQEDRDAARQHLALGLQDPDATHAWALRKCRRDGEVLWVEEWARAVPGPNSTQELLVVCQDITARRAAEQALRDSEARLVQAQKQEALGRMAGGIAHDFGNLLTVVLGHCDAARQMLASDSPILEELQGIREAAQQATNLSRQLLTFSRRQVVQPVPLQLDDVVARMTPLFRRVLGDRVALEVVWLPGLPRVLADPGQVEQVLTNLVVNARDAIVEHGTVRIASSLVSASAFTSETGMPGEAARTYLCMSIRDDGVGMAADVQGRAFEPFFTTKADDRGTGLGLPTVHAILTQAGGGVALQSAPGDGCDVRVYWPTIPVSVAAAPPPAEPRALPGGAETILLVEDREAVRRVAQRFLTRRGYRVLEAEGAERAMELAEQHANEIDLLLSDVILGGMDGYELALTLTGRQPGLRVILMSGYPSEMLSRAGRTGPVFPFVNKPIDFPTLAQLLRDQLERRGP